jgi:Mlc titration factor MtfA (ptsG expression regulator)
MPYARIGFLDLTQRDLMFDFLKQRRRTRLRATAVPVGWRRLIARNVPYVALLPVADQAELMGHMQVLLAEKKFLGCAGLKITDEIRVTIACQAAVLLLHRDTDYFPMMRTILVYPEKFVSEKSHTQPDGTVLEESVIQAGESWYRGPVILSWQDVLYGAADPRDGYNVVFHEFAHQLDDESGGTEGAPRLATGRQYQTWSRVFGREYEELQNAVLDDRASLLDEYGAESPAEFFAVATECFFERPRALSSRHPELYGQMASYYRQDPAAYCPE